MGERTQQISRPASVSRNDVELEYAASKLAYLTTLQNKDLDLKLTNIARTIKNFRRVVGSNCRTTLDLLEAFANMPEESFDEALNSLKLLRQESTDMPNADLLNKLHKMLAKSTKGESEFYPDLSRNQIQEIVKAANPKLIIDLKSDLAQQLASFAQQPREVRAAIIDAVSFSQTIDRQLRIVQTSIGNINILANKLKFEFNAKDHNSNVLSSTEAFKDLRLTKKFTEFLSGTTVKDFLELSQLGRKASYIFSTGLENGLEEFNKLDAYHKNNLLGLVRLLSKMPIYQEFKTELLTKKRHEDLATLKLPKRQQIESEENR